ncbi:MAG: molybdopterin-dependent oxidoreductase [Synergistaceae bacterium]|jgi:aldehyde oxidoreductase|nr:molybdopterin-dependent oxidoreductase [Synergistaceae bacterium]
MTDRKVLNINGVERSILCDVEKDTLADVIRNLGLTGTKVGCGTGHCGACNVILDGKLIRSCVRKISTVPDYSTIFTIEGMGTAYNLHPLQLAWIVHGGVQCGFCTPGFIVSAKALLDKNPNPTRTQVRDWFQDNKNACRCTGYKPLVDAVMDAAKVMRGEKTMDEMAYKMPEDGRVYGTRHVRPEALGKVLGVTDFGDDIGLKSKEVWYLAPVTPNVSHAVIKSVDYSEAEKAPGVFQIITSKDVKGINRITFPIGSKFAKSDGFERPILNDTKVFRMGDIIALVAADTRRHAREAAKLVKVEYEKLPEYLDILDAMADDAVQIHPGIPNIMLTKPLFKGEDTREVFKRAAHVAEGSFSTPMQPHLPVEPEVGQAYVDKDGNLTILYKSHALYMAAGLIAAGVGLPPEKIRVIMNPSGGAFGYSLSPGFAGLLGVAALATGHLVSLTMSYEEHQHYSGKRAASYTNGRLACDENGKLTASELDLAYDKGSFSELVNPTIDVAMKVFGLPYNIPNCRHLAKGVFSNKAFSTAYRCPGVPQILLNIETLMDVLAEKVGMDPLEFRYINALREGQTAPFGLKLNEYPYETLLNKIRPKYKALLERAKKDSTPEKPHGVGIACGFFLCAQPGDHAEAALELNADGTVTVYNTWQEMGQGSTVGTLAFTHEALRPLSLKPEQIKLVMNDTKYCPNTGPSGGSRSNIMCGGAIEDAANKLLSAMRKPDGTYRTFQEMEREKIPTKYIGAYDRDPNPLASGPEDLPDENTGYGAPSQEFCCAAFTSEVEVDVATGKTTVIALHCVSDIGRVTNYTSVDGQAYGGMEHSLGYALSEQYADLKKHATLAGAGFTYINSMPDGDDFTAEYTEIPRKFGPFKGVGGASESFQSASHVAITNAIYKAAGVRIYSLPATPEKVKQAIDDKKNGTLKPLAPYYLGGDFNDTLDYMKAHPVE